MNAFILFSVYKKLELFCQDSPGFYPGDFAPLSSLGNYGIIGIQRPSAVGQVGTIEAVQLYGQPQARF